MRKKNRGEKLKVLLEMRPALEGFAGIPQEVRLLFRGLRDIEEVELEGMLQTSHRFLSAGMEERKAKIKRHSYLMNRYSKVIVSMAETPYGSVVSRFSAFLRRRLSATSMAFVTSLGMGRVPLGRFDSSFFPDFTWRTLFAKSLGARDFNAVEGAQFRICAIPWHTLHLAGLTTLGWKNSALYPKIDTRGVDYFIGQTPYPGRVSRGTQLVIRYHDAIPVFMPHTIPDKSIHQATHFHALQANVQNGAWFACVSEATRQDLLRIFPEVKDRSLTIHNMVSPSYFYEEAQLHRVPAIIRGMLHEGDKAKDVKVNPDFLTNAEREAFYRRHLEGADLRYLLMVSTIEPRKNHLRLLAAWEHIKQVNDPKLKLVVVGGLGWDYAQILRRFSPWIERGELFMLSGVSVGDLRVLYRNSIATVCPSLGEGFDFSGVEAMSSGGIVIASDIPVHREIYQNASVYFSPYSTGSLVEILQATLYAPDSEKSIRDLKKNGSIVAARYLPERIMPKWKAFFDSFQNRATQ